MDIKEKFFTVLETISIECDTQKFVRHLIELLYDVNARYARIYAFQEMFYEFIEHGSKREYRAAIELLRILYEENAESGKIIVMLKGWSYGNKNVRCNEGRMNIKRYLSVLANRQLRMKYLGF